MTFWKENPGGKSAGAIRQARSHAHQVCVIILRCLGFDAGGTLMDNCGTVVPLSQYASENECLGLLAADGRRHRIKDLTREIIHSVQDPRAPKARQEKVQRACREAWRLVSLAQAAGRITRKEHEVVWQCMRMTPSLPPAPVKTDDDFRQALVETYGFLTLGGGLEVRQSTQGPAIASNLGLFLSEAQPPLKKNQRITFYDGISVALSSEEMAAHSERGGWFIATGFASATSAVLVGFTSADTREAAFPVNAGLMSLCNSAQDAGATCRKAVLEKSTGAAQLLIKGRPISRLPILVAKDTIEPGAELLWDYNVR